MPLSRLKILNNRL
uniref:Uncharacterized protein n=1 Tax=Anguilla anguilla TaxID=7936 RepID=A0A0E9XSW0_ANGAN